MGAYWKEGAYSKRALIKFFVQRSVTLFGLNLYLKCKLDINSHMFVKKVVVIKRIIVPLNG